MTDDRRALDQQLWEFVYAYDAAYDRAAQSAGLSSAQACLLDSLSEGGRSMGELAGALLCDASNVTQLVARLESRGWVTRAPDTTDRRVKRVSITPEGRAVSRRVRSAFAFPSDALDRLDGQEQQQLAGLLGKMVGGQPPSAPA